MVSERKLSKGKWQLKDLSWFSDSPACLRPHTLSLPQSVWPRASVQATEGPRLILRRAAEAMRIQARWYLASIADTLLACHTIFSPRDDPKEHLRGRLGDTGTPRLQVCVTWPASRFVVHPRRKLPCNLW